MSDKWVHQSGYGHPPPYYGGYPPPPSVAYVPAPVVLPAIPAYQPPQPPAPEPCQPTYVTNYIYHQPVDAVQVLLQSLKYYSNLSESTPSYHVQTPGPSYPIYISNHYYQPQTTTPTTVVNNPPAPQHMPDPIDWVLSSPHTAQNLAHRAVVAGKEGWDSSPLWIIRAHHSGELIPGKLAVKHRQAYIPHGGKEVPVHNFEVLCAPPHMIRWLPASNGQVPVGAIPAGNTHTGETLYIGRARYMRSLTPGKVHPSHGCLYISFGGGEVPHKQYEVLCNII